MTRMSILLFFLLLLFCPVLTSPYMTLFKMILWIWKLLFFWWQILSHCQETSLVGTTANSKKIENNFSCLIFLIATTHTAQSYCPEYERGGGGAGAGGNKKGNSCKYLPEIYRSPTQWISDLATKLTTKLLLSVNVT